MLNIDWVVAQLRDLFKHLAMYDALHYRYGIYSITTLSTGGYLPFCKAEMHYVINALHSPATVPIMVPFISLKMLSPEHQPLSYSAILQK